MTNRKLTSRERKFYKVMLKAAIKCKGEHSSEVIKIINSILANDNNCS